MQARFAKRTQLEVSEGAAPLTRRRRSMATHVFGASKVLR
jgi:hypothetical protein